MMNEFASHFAYGAVAVSLLSYAIGAWLRRRFNSGVFNPLMISILLTMGFLLVAHIDFEVYNAKADVLSWFLTPATVCLAVPLYEQMQVLKKNYKAIIAGIGAGVLTSLLTGYLLALAFHQSHQEYVTLLSKSITTAIGMGVTEELGGYVTITVAVIVLTGVLGNIFAESILKVFRITEPIAKGIAIGCSSHAVGTAKAMEIGPVEGALSGLSIAVAGLLTVILAPFFAYLI